MTHTPVLLNETLDALAVDPEGVYLDATVGAGGHALAIVRRLQGGRLIGLDRDPIALAATRITLAGFENQFELYPSNFAQLKHVMSRIGVDHLHGALFDLGVSSMQLDRPERGFSFRRDGPLDMRMGPDAPRTAAELVNAAAEPELKRVLRDYGEERFADRIARAIVEHRPFQNTTALAAVVEAAIPAPAKRGLKVHPATRTFQAIRIAVNGELEVIETGLGGAFELLMPGGRLAVISFHSLEDRLVKQFFRDKERGCTCPPRLPDCVCGRLPQADVLTPVVPSADEVAQNPRARSARLRMGIKLGGRHS